MKHYDCLLILDYVNRLPASLSMAMEAARKPPGWTSLWVRAASRMIRAPGEPWTKQRSACCLKNGRLLGWTFWMKQR